MMEKDKTLEELFRNFNPKLNDDDVFMQNLNKKLDAVEYLKEIQNRQLRHYRYALIAAFIVGIVCGCAISYYLLVNPDAFSSFVVKSNIPVISLLLKNISTVVISAIIIVVCYAVTAVINLIHELKLMRENESRCIAKNKA